jgi:hypothetical protein
MMMMMMMIDADDDDHHHHHHHHHPPHDDATARTMGSARLMPPPRVIMMTVAMTRLTRPSCGTGFQVYYVGNEARTVIAGTDENVKVGARKGLARGCGKGSVVVFLPSSSS